MPKIIETTVYRLTELSDTAKDKARAWYREGGFDYDWYDAVYADFQRIAEIMGVQNTAVEGIKPIEKRRVRR